MEQLIFVGIIVLFSILEAVARKGKERRDGGEVELPEPPVGLPDPGPRPRAGRGSSPPSYDDDPSFDEAVKGRVEGEGASRPPRPRTGSEGLIPADVWEEIQALARGEVPGTGDPVPQKPRPPAPPPPTTAPPTRIPPKGGERRPNQPERRGQPQVRRSAPPVRVEKPAGKPAKPVRSAPAVPVEEGTPGHPVHLSHAAYGTPVRGRLTPAATSRADGPSVEALGARALLAGGPGALRQAVILQELLGPPVALKGDRFGHQTEE